MSFSFDFSNDKPDLREPIPAGTKVLVRMNYTPGGAGSSGALTKSKPPSDSEYLKAEFTVLRGPYKGRKFWSNMTVSGGKLDEKGRSMAGDITRKNIRLILDASEGLSSKDDSPAAAAKRVLPNGFADLQGRQFVCKVKIEPAQNGYAARNGLGQILTIDHSDYPKSEAELDSPVVAGAKPATLPLVVPPWEQPAQPTAEPNANAIVNPEPVVATPSNLARPAQQSNGGVPAWMNA